MPPVGFEPTISAGKKINDVTVLIIINFVKSKILIIKSTLFPHRNTVSTLRLTENAHSFDQILRDRKRNSSLHYVLSEELTMIKITVFEKVRERERPSVNKREVQKINMERYCNKKLNDNNIRNVSG